MDRHDVSEAVTAENVAQLHQQDLKVQDQFGCRGLTYWFDDKRKTAFCLIEAENPEAIHEMHKHAHGEVPHSVIEVDPGIVESFLGRIEDPAKAANTELNIINDPAFRTIMIMTWSGVKPVYIDKFKSLLNDHHDSVRIVLKDHGGSAVKQTENQLLVSFLSVSKAIQAAIKVQAILKKFKHETKDESFVFKMSLNAGVPVTKKQLIFEDTIKLAERMCEVIKGEIIVSAEVKDLYKMENSNEFAKGKNIVVLSPADEDFLNNLMDYLESTWTNVNLKVDDFVKPMKCSKSQLYRKIISLTGESINPLLKNID